jgi:hypothetical protein
MALFSRLLAAFNSSYDDGGNIGASITTFASSFSNPLVISCLLGVS